MRITFDDLHFKLKLREFQRIFFSGRNRTPFVQSEELFVVAFADIFNIRMTFVQLCDNFQKVEGTGCRLYRELDSSVWLKM